MRKDIDVACSEFIADLQNRLRTSDLVGARQQALAKYNEVLDGKTCSEYRDHYKTKKSISLSTLIYYIVKVLKKFEE